MKKKYHFFYVLKLLKDFYSFWAPVFFSKHCLSVCKENENDKYTQEPDVGECL